MGSSALLPQRIKTTPRRRSRRFLRWGAVLVLLIVFVYFFQPIQLFLDYALVYETPMKHVDAVFISQLGETKTAAELFHNGSAKRILITRGPRPEYINADPPISAHVFIREELLQQQAPAHAIANLPYQATTAVDFHRLVREWVFANNVKSIVQFPPKYYSAYAHWKHERTLGLEGIELIIRPVETDGIWRKQILALQNFFVRAAWWRLVDLPKIQEEFGYDQMSLNDKAVQNDG